MATQKETSAKESDADLPDEIERIKALIKNGTVTAISVDTSIFDANQQKLDKGLFAQLQQFKRHTTCLVISEVVYREIKNHLTSNLSTTKSRFSKDMLEVCEFVGGDANEVASLKAKLDALPPPEEMCERQLAAFIENSSAQVILANDHVKMGELVDIYFNKHPPFHATNTKKSEFPDAIALRTLENWAVANGRQMLVVSKDNDWKSFCEHSKHLHLLKDLATALQLFQMPLSDSVQPMVDSFKARLEDKDSDISALLRQLLMDHIWSDAKIDATSQFDFDAKGIALREINEMLLLDGEEGIKLVDIGHDFATINCEFQVSGMFVIDFSFRNWEGSDRKFFNMGENQVIARGDVELSVIFRLPLDGKTTGEMEFEMQFGDLFIEAGEIGPDWMTLLGLNDTSLKKT